MTWTKHSEVVEKYSTSQSPSNNQPSECFRLFFKDAYNGAFQMSSDTLQNIAISWGIGLFVFPFCLGVLQVGVFKPLSLTSSHILAPAFGLCSVAASGIAASLSVIYSYSNHRLHAAGPPHVDVHLADLVCYGLGASALFKLLGGRFQSVLPSTVLEPGAFARHWVPASKNYASSGKKVRLATIGKRHGCHTCGRRWMARMFIADHQPPLSVPKKSDILRSLTNVFRPHQPEYRFYPQCPSCSQVQQSYLSAMALQRNGELAPKKAVRIDFNHIVTHSTTLRLYHLYLPLPVLIATAYQICVG